MADRGPPAWTLSDRGRGRGRAVVVAVVLVPLVLAADRPARAQCPSCSNPNFATAPLVAPAGAERAGTLVVGLQAAYLRSAGLLDDGREDALTGRLESSTATLYQHRVVQLEARYAFTSRLAAAVLLPFESRDMLNRAFPAEGQSGLRRHQELAGPGDALLAGRVRLDPPEPPGHARFVAWAGALLPTGPTSDARPNGPFETVLQIGSGTVIPAAGAEAAIDHRAGPLALVGAARLDGRASLYANAQGFRRGSTLLATALGGAGPTRWPGFATLLGPELFVRAADQREGLRVLDTGGVTVSALLAQTVRLGADLDAALSVRLPIVQRLDGLQIAEGFAATAGFSWRARRP